jgi:hypothetical protein
VPKEEVARNETILKHRFQKWKTVSHTRKRHRVIPLEENMVGCHKISESDDFEDIVVVDAY